MREDIITERVHKRVRELMLQVSSSAHMANARFCALQLFPDRLVRKSKGRSD